MPVLSSSYTLEHEQIDGSRWCLEVHETTRGPREFYYLLAAGDDAQAIMEGHVPVVAAMLADEEIAENFERDGPPTFDDCSQVQFALHMRDLFAASEGIDTCRIAWWLERRLEDGSLTPEQCQATMGLDPVAWTAFRAGPLVQLATVWATVLAAKGV